MRRNLKQWDPLVIGGSNAMAVRKAEKFERGKAGYRQLLVYGSTGCGKTAITEIVRNHLRNKGLTLRVRCADDFTSELITWLSKGYSIEEYYRNYRMVDVLMIEDVQDLLGRPTVMEILLKLVELMQKNGKRIWLTAEKKEILGDLNLEGFNTVKLFEQDFSMKKRILRQYAKSKGFKVPDAILTMLAEQKENIRTIQGLLNMGMFYHEMLGRPLDQELFDKVDKLESGFLRRLR